jgi:SWI/SNF-related matrix-associated actin-dependent regulator 1 of chromatin subfamily A
MSTGYTREEKGRLLELQARLRSNFMIRRLKNEVLDELPDKRYELTHVEPNGNIREVLAKEKLIDFDPETLLIRDFKMDGAVATVRREMGEAMVPRVVEHIKYLLDIVELKKVVLFAHHRSVIAALVESLNKYGVIVRMGGQGAIKQQEAIDEFVSDDKIRIFIGQLDTMEGADGLQRVTDYCVFAEPAWTPGRNEQCVDRLHRKGQHGNVVAQFMLAEGSFNEKVLKSVLHKAHDIHETLDSRKVE